MKPAQPYQPLLLRILHGLTALSLVAAILTAFWTYDTYDRRWGGLPLPRLPEIEGIHGTFGLYTLLIFPFFAFYAFRRGQRRLLQADSLQKLSQIGKPIWWVTLHQLANTLVMFALTFALFSGKMMDETWLPRGELNHGWYYAHLISWLLMVVAIGLHLLMSARVGGTPLLLSMLNWRFHPQESPRHWDRNLRQWKARWQGNFWASYTHNPGLYFWLELAVLLTLLAAWMIPLIKG